MHQYCVVATPQSVRDTIRYLTPGGAAAINAPRFGYPAPPSLTRDFADGQCRWTNSISLGGESLTMSVPND